MITVIDRIGKRHTWKKGEVIVREDHVTIWIRNKAGELEHEYCFIKPVSVDGPSEYFDS